ncbi:histidine kinase [Asanoa sp. NPDC049573]|uniref:sensor histidine kinase n=1 Tax=Asanoa sp. NPDC049573 TaxID=3155396 RepID=UPI003443B760
MRQAAIRFGVAVAVAAAIAGVLLAVRGPVTGLDAWLTASAAAYLPVALVGAAMARREPGNPVGWIFLVSGAALPLANLLNLLGGLAAELVSGGLTVLAIPLAALFGVLLFPDGRLGSGRRRALACAYAIALVLLLVYGLCSPTLIDQPGVPNPLSLGGWVDALLVVVLLLGPMIALAAWSLLRKARAAGGDRGAAMRLAAFAGFGCAATFFACLAVGMTSGDTEQITVLENTGPIVLGVAAWVGIVRYGLFDTRVVVSRTLVYGALTAVVLAVYAGVALAVGRVAGGAIAALAALPLRDVLQRRVNHWVYGLRDEPITALARLGERLDAAGAPGEALGAAAGTVADALRLSYVEIEVGGAVVATHGRRGPEPVRELPLPFAGETIGRLVLQSRHADSSLADEALLANLSRQVAVVAHAVTLAAEVRQSRERLVTAREEERRRLRRDLHDGLGPTLAGIALGIDTVRRALPAGAQDDADRLDLLRGEAQRAVADIRRIVYDLRPPVLDELGLAGAVREQALRLGCADVDVADLPPLPAAVEVAAYRIALEALANASRHAPGAPVSVTVSSADRLVLRIADAGGGIPDGYRAGVGIASMRERAAEVGGSFVIGPGPSGGTLVVADLPLAVP